jgi:hypothetical protein
MRDPVGKDLLKRIADGMLVSTRTPQEVLKFYKTAK